MHLGNRKGGLECLQRIYWVKSIIETNIAFVKWNCRVEDMLQRK